MAELVDQRMITRSKLAEQLREYQIRYKMSSVSLISAASNLATSRVDVTTFIICELFIVAFFVLTVVSLYFRHIKLAILLLCITLLVLFSMKITK